MHRQIFIGFDPRWVHAYAVTRASIQRFNRKIVIHPLILDELRRLGWYRRETHFHGDQLFDQISQHPMATEFAISRFLVPLIQKEGMALFMDSDMMLRCDIAEAFKIAERNPQYAVMCVKHDYKPDNTTKMNGQAQSQYNRKNWSSFMIFNCDHPSNREKLTLEMVNGLPGRDLHRFCWLDDSEIGALDPEWNYLVGHTDRSVRPKNVHFTEGVPTMRGCENCEYADEWRCLLYDWAEDKLPSKISVLDADHASLSSVASGAS